MEAYEASLEADPAWTETALRITRERMALPPPSGGASCGRCARFRGRFRSRGSRSWRRSTSRRWWSPATTRPIRGIHTRSPRPGRSASPRGGWSARSPASRRSPGRAAASRARSRTSWRSRPVSERLVLGRRSSSRITSRSPDQVSSIAQTLLSTRRLARPSSRATSSVMSVSTPEERFGQAIQRPAAGSIARRSAGQPPLELGPARGEEDDHVERPARPGLDRDALREGAEQILESLGRARERDPVSRLDAELLRQRGPRIAGHFVYFTGGSGRRQPDPLRRREARHARLRVGRAAGRRRRRGRRQLPRAHPGRLHHREPERRRCASSTPPRSPAPPSERCRLTIDSAAAAQLPPPEQGAPEFSPRRSGRLGKLIGGSWRRR